MPATQSSRNGVSSGMTVVSKPAILPKETAMTKFIARHAALVAPPGNPPVPRLRERAAAGLRDLRPKDDRASEAGLVGGGRAGTTAGRLSGVVKGKTGGHSSRDA